jgi:hypothetical protein
VRFAGDRIVVCYFKQSGYVRTSCPLSWIGITGLTPHCWGRADSSNLDQETLDTAHQHFDQIASETKSELLASFRQILARKLAVSDDPGSGSLNLRGPAGLDYLLPTLAVTLDPHDPIPRIRLRGVAS